ncbi:MAG: hypothetical protein JSU07_00575 [Bacteroidetes bacterium]|nr:hypothetical protein [Bacteroidota bacterium]
MLFARNSKIANIEIYVSFLNDVIEKDSESYKNILNNIVDITHKLTTGKIDSQSIPSEIFDVVSILAIHQKAFFTKINPAQIQKEDYQSIKSFLEKDLFEIA